MLSMAYCPGPAYPAPPSYFAVHPASHGFMARYINEVKEQVYSELQAQRAKRLGPQKSSYNDYAHSPRYTEAYYTPPAKKLSPNPRLSEPRVPFPVPKIGPPPLGPPFPSPQVPTQSQHISPASIPEAQPPPLIRFPTPQPYGAGPRASYSMQIPSSPPDAPAGAYPLRVYQGPAQVLPFPDPSESTPLLSRPPPSMFGNSNASTNGRSSCHSSLLSVSSGPPRRRRIDYNTLRRAAENMKVCKQETAGWANLIRQTRAEKLSAEERDVTSLVEELHQKASTALKMTLAVLHIIYDSQEIRHDAQFISGKVTADISTVATLATSVQHKLASLVRHLKDAKEVGRAKPPGFFSRVGNIVEDAPGCLAGLYLKGRLFQFTSLTKAQRGQYSDLGSKAHIGSDRLPMSKLMSSLYCEVWRTYSIVSKALSGFESSMHAFRLELRRKRWVEIGVE